MQTITYTNADCKIKIETRYTVEFLASWSDDGPQRWKHYQCSWEPWELVDKRVFDDVGAAWEFYLWRLLDKNTYMVNPIFEEIMVDGVTVRESHIEESPTFQHTLHDCVNREMRRELDTMQRAESDTAALLADYMEFMEKYNAGHMFREFQEEKRR